MVVRGKRDLDGGRLSDVEPEHALPGHVARQQPRVESFDSRVETQALQRGAQLVDVQWCSDCAESAIDVRLAQPRLADELDAAQRAFDRV